MSSYDLEVIGSKPERDKHGLIRSTVCVILEPKVSYWLRAIGHYDANTIRGIEDIFKCTLCLSWCENDI